MRKKAARPERSGNSLAEADGNRTHHSLYRRDAGFEDREGHQTPNASRRRRLYRAARWLAAGLMLACFLFPAACSARELTVILADHLSYAMVSDDRAGVLTPEERRRAAVALLSPGLPNSRHGTPMGNLYASLSAGDVIDRSNAHAGLLERQLAASRGAVSFVHFGDVAAPKRLEALRLLLASSQGSVLLVGVTPVEGRDRSGRVYWNSLTPVVWINPPAMVPGTTLTSETTHTVGLIALRDIAPTILAAENLPIPESMSGHASETVEIPTLNARDALLARMDTLSRSNAEAQHWFGWVYGLGGGAMLLAAVACILSGGRFTRAAPGLRFLMRFLVAVPLAQLIAPWLVLGNPAVYLLEMTAAAALLAWLVGVIWRRSPLTALLAITTAVIIIDAFAGTPLVSRALFSGYWLSGIRFYGIGNEFMGMLLGAALLAPVIGASSESPERPKSVGSFALAVWFAAALVALAYPQFGAKAGGAVTALAAFLPAWWALRRDQEVSWRVWLVSIAVGFALVFAFSALSHALGGRDTHIQDATAAALRGNLGYIAQVALRKAKMAVRIALAPGTFGGIMSLGLLFILWLRSGLRERVGAFLGTRAFLRRALVAGLWGMLACVLFNDSGAAAMLLMGGILALSLLHEMLTELICAYSPSTSAMLESASRSATSLNSALIR